MNKPRYTVAVQDGWLCIVYSLAMQEQPIIVSHYWPIRRACGEDFTYPELVTEILDHYQGHFSLRLGSHNWREVRLKDGGKTRPIRSTEQPYPKPKTRVETRYARGHWQKYLKSRGWVRA